MAGELEFPKKTDLKKCSREGLLAFHCLGFWNGDVEGTDGSGARRATRHEQAG